MPITQKQKEITYMILSALSFAAMQIVVRLIREISTMEQVFMRSLFILIAACYMTHRNRGSYFGERRYQVDLFGCSASGLLGPVTLFYASSHTTQGDVTIPNKLSPIFVTLLTVVFIKEKMLPIRVPALALSVLGASIVFRPSFQSNPLPPITALLSALTSGIAYTPLGYLKDKVGAMTITMYFSTFSVVGSLPLMIGNFVVPSLSQLLFLILIGVFGPLGQAFITYAYRYAPASEISIYNYSGILFSLLFGLIVLGESVKFTSMIGGALIAAASPMAFVYSSRIGKKI